MSIPAFKVGDMVFVVDDPDLAFFPGITGKVVKIGVETSMGPGLIFETSEFGELKGSYDCFARVQ